MAVQIVSKFHSFKLGDLIDLKKGQRIEPKVKGNYPIFGAGEKEVGYADTWNNDGKITITRKGTVGKVYKREFKHFVAEASFILEVKSQVILENYLYEWLKNEEYLIKQLKTPALIAELDKKSFLNLQIKVPSLERQRKVVSALKIYRSELQEQEKIIKKQIEVLEKCRNSILDEIIEGVIKNEKNRMF